MEHLAALILSEIFEYVFYLMTYKNMLIRKQQEDALKYKFKKYLLYSYTTFILCNVCV